MAQMKNGFRLICKEEKESMMDPHKMQTELTQLCSSKKKEIIIQEDLIL